MRYGGMLHFVRILGATIFGAEARLVDVQVSIRGTDDSNENAGEQRFLIVGLPDSALREGRERIRSAILHGYWSWPKGAITVNLAPATARKEGAGLDLPIALGLLAATGVIPTPRRTLCLGELSLDGRLRPVRGALASVEQARRHGVRWAIVPAPNGEEAAAVPGVDVVAAKTLGDVVAHLSGEVLLDPVAPRAWAPVEDDEPVGLRGQPILRYAARIAAAGGHNLLLHGPPGSGKTLAARHLRGLLPPLTYEEAVEVSRIHSIAGLLEHGLVRRRPFRAPHHTTSEAGLIGGGQIPRPGEVSLAHLGVLFLDELPEYARHILETLRQPIEDGTLVLGRAAGRAELPTEVVLVAAMNPCPCGWHGTGDESRCRCSGRDIERYRRRVSGPLRDRFDLQVPVEAVDPGALVDDAPTDVEDAAEREALARAAEAQAKRQEVLGLPRPWNARIPARLLPGAVVATPAAEQELVERARRLGLTGRGVHRVLRVARTIADLEGDPEVEPDHLRQALGFRGE